MTEKIYLISLNDNGASGPKIGCGDSVIGVDRVLPASTSPLTDGVKELVSLHDKYYGQSGLYNALFQSRLTVDYVSLVEGKATIRLNGTITLSGECDDPRFEAQLRYTALQFPTVKTVDILINGKPLSTVIGGHG